MKLYLDQQVFSFGDKFYVKDETGTPLYFIHKPVFSLTFEIYDMNDNLLATVSKRMFRNMFDISIKGRTVATVYKRFTLFLESYEILGTSWTLNGDFTGHEYTLSDGTRTIMQVSKKWLSWGDSYMLDIVNPVDHIIGIAMVLAVDAVKAAQD